MIRQLCSQLVLRGSRISPRPVYHGYGIDETYHFRHLSLASSMDFGWLAYPSFAASADQMIQLKVAPRLVND